MATAITISEGVTLAIHGISVIAYKSPQRLNVKQMAEILKSSEAHLAKVFQKLSRAGLVNSLRGPHGGFAVSRSFDKITFLDVYEAIEGKLQRDICPLGGKKCVFNGCSIGDSMCELSNKLYDSLKRSTLQELVDNLDIKKFKL